MRRLSLDYFQIPQGQHYHIYRVDGSRVVLEPHTHSYYQICYVECGCVIHWQDDTDVQLSAGDAFIVPPGFVHRILFPEKNAYIYSLSFQEDIFHPGLSQSNVYNFLTALKLDAIKERQLDVRMRIRLSREQRSTMKALMDSLIRESDSPFPDELSAAPSLVAAIVCILSQGYSADTSRQARLQDVERYNKSLEDCLAYIDTHFTQPLTLNGLAHDFALSRSNFSLLFPKYTGMTLKRYIAKKRIDYAVLLMQNNSLSIQEIAHMVGYEDFSTFYRNFAKITGVPPSAYRAGTSGEKKLSSVDP